jgi:hypothetical protein
MAKKVLRVIFLLALLLTSVQSVHADNLRRFRYMGTANFTMPTGFTARQHVISMTAVIRQCFFRKAPSVIILNSLFFATLTEKKKEKT